MRGMMNRRIFLGFLGGAAVSAVTTEAIPLARIWSFPSKIRIASIQEIRGYVALRDSSGWRSVAYRNDDELKYLRAYPWVVVLRERKIPKWVA
jgi:hypothetical protein